MELSESSVLVPIEHVRPSPYRVRMVMDGEVIRRLKAEAKQVKRVAPVVVWERFDEKRRYVVIEGEWRRRVALMAGFRSLPVVIRPVEDLRDAEIQTLVAELSKEGTTTPVAEGEAYARLVALGMTQTRIAKEVNRDKSLVSFHMRLPKLPEYVRVMIEAKLLNERRARELYRFRERPQALRELVTRTLKEGLSGRKLAKVQLSDLGVGEGVTDLDVNTHEVWRDDGRNATR